LGGLNRRQLEFYRSPAMTLEISIIPSPATRRRRPPYQTRPAVGGRDGERVGQIPQYQLRIALRVQSWRLSAAPRHADKPRPDEKIQT